MRGLNAQSAFGAAKVKDQIIRKFGPESAFEIVGQVQRTTGSLHAEQGSTEPKCIQKYISMIPSFKTGQGLPTSPLLN